MAVIVVAGAGSIWILSNRAIATTYSVPEETVPIVGDSAEVARGRHLASAIGKCTDCHGDNLAGQAMSMGPLGTFVAPNLTTGAGGVAPLTDAQWVRAIRHAVAPDGRSLIFMPSTAYNFFSAEDLAAVIAYLKSVPPVANQLPATKVGPIGRLMIARQPGRLVYAAAVDHARPIPPAVPVGVTPEYGGYLSVVGGCTSCHGSNLRGGLQEGPPGTPPSADLTPGGPLSRWSEEDFRHALRTGIRPDGSTINPFMPWRLTREMTDDEISAVWEYLKTVGR